MIHYGRYTTADTLQHIYIYMYIASNKNGHISTNVQHQKISIAVFEPACGNMKNTTTRHRDFGEVGTVKPQTQPPSYILYIKTNKKDKYTYILCR